MAQTNRFLKPCELLAILNELAKSGETGTLVLQRESTTKFLYLQEGQVIFAASNAPEDKFTQILIEKGRLTIEQVALATEKKGNKTIGRTLVDLGFLSSEDLLDSLVEQVKKISVSVALWPSGTASFKPNILPPGVAKLPITTQRLILDTVSSIEDRSIVGSALGGLEAVFEVQPAQREAASAIQLTQQEASIIDLLDGHRTLQEVCDQVGVDVFFGARFVLGLTYLNLAQKGREPFRDSEIPQAKMDLSFLDDVVPLAPESREFPPEPPPPPQQTEAVTDELDSFQPQLFSGEGETHSESAVQEVEEALDEQMQEYTPETHEEPSVTPLSDESDSGVPKVGPRSPRVVYPEKVENRWRFYKKAVLYFTIFLIVGVTWALWYVFAPQAPSSKDAHKNPAGTKTVNKPAPTPTPFSAPITGVPSAPPGPQAANAPSGAQKEPSPAPAPHKNQPAVQPQAPAPQTAKPVTAAPAPAKPANVAAVTPAPPAKPAPTPAPVKEPPKPAPAAPSKPRELLMSGKYKEAAKAFQQESPSHRGSYTIFLEIACQDETISKACQASGGRSELIILPQTFSGKSCYKVMWGSYRSKQEAEAALKSLPLHFKEASSPPRIGPWPSP